MWGSMADEATVWFVWWLVRCYFYILRQPELREVVRESSVPWQFEAYRDQVSLYQGYGAEGEVKLQYFVTDEQIADVLTKPLTKVKFEYFRKKLGVLQIEVPSKGKWWVREPYWHGERIGSFLPWSDVRVEPFCHGERIGSFMSYVSVKEFWCDYRIGFYMIIYKHWIPFLEWRHLVSY